MGDEASCSYNEPFTVRFRGKLDADLLCNAIQTVVARHGSLHVAFDQDGRYQESQPAIPVDMVHDDIASLNDSEQK